jgi:hypothetical protein
MIFRRKTDIDHEEAFANAQEAIVQLENQQQKVTALAAWLDNRKNQNGFGADFEFTLRPKGTR